MANLTSSFNALLKGHEAPPTKPFTTDTADEFLQEAYRISSLITRLHSELRSLRQSYLSTAGPRKTHLRTTSRNGHNNSHQQTVYLTDRDREEIDANAKLTLRDLHARIRALEDAEKLRQSTQSAVIQNKYARGLGALGSWAAGGGRGGKGKTQEHAAAEAAALQLGAHREGVIWYLGQRLQETAKTQQAMMETRLTREMEKNRSVLAKARGPIMAKMASDLNSAGSSSSQWGGGATGLAMEEEERRRQQPPSDDLTEEQKQMFEKGNQDMLKHYQSTLDKVRAAEQSLVQISELQNQLVGNLTAQSAHIDQLVAESFETTEGVGKGNKQLEKSTGRTSSARWTFHATLGLCAVLVALDLLV